MYAKFRDLIKRFGVEELYEVAPGNGPETYNEDAITAALQDAKDEIDSYISELHEVPLADPVPNIIVTVCCDIARYRYFNNHVTDEVQSRYEARVKWLEKVVNGEVGIPGLKNQQSAITGRLTKKTASDRIFTRSKLDCF